MTALWTLKGSVGRGTIVEAETVATGVPKTGVAMDVATLDFVSFEFDLTRVAATSIEWWMLGSVDGVVFTRVPVVNTVSGNDLVHADGENTRAQAVSGRSFPGL